MANPGYSFYSFPSDLTSDQQKHFMKIQIFPSPKGSAAGQRHNIFLFVPGGNQNGPMMWQMVHDYDDVKLTKLGTGAIGALTRMLPGAGSALGQAAGAAGRMVAGGALAGARVAGLGTINPKVDVLYGNTELRQFQFSFFMAPQSEKETEELDKIVRVLRKFSSPEITRLPPGLDQFVPNIGAFNSASGQVSQLESGLWFVPPAEFIVSFHTVTTNDSEPSQLGEKTNPYIPQIGRCVLTRVDVNYTQQGEYSTFKDGAPTNLQLDLYFREMRVISQADITNGY
jgi:hypothetical protein